jgi:hypothetical protein
MVNSAINISLVEIDLEIESGGNISGLSLK